MSLVRDVGNKEKGRCEELRSITAQYQKQQVAFSKESRRWVVTRMVCFNASAVLLHKKGAEERDLRHSARIISG
jgi:hypothetical protein